MTMKTIETAIDIAAAPARVWQILTDFPAHAEWNPFITSIAGPLAVGEKLSIRVQPPGGKGMTFRPVLLVADEARELRWKGRLLLPGLFDGEHLFRLEPNGTGTRLHHGERFSGLFVAMTGRASFAQIERGFHAMNEALKRRAEG
jgi:hypothetical protein